MKPNSTRILLVALLGIICGGVVEPSAESVAGLTLTVRPEKSAVLPGEPCEIFALLGNQGGAELNLNLGADGVEAFRFDILDATDRAICQSSAIKKYDLSRSGKVVLPASGSVERRVVLNHWCTTSLPPGKYAVVCHLATPSGELVARCELTIVPADDKRLDSVFTDLVGVILSDRPVAERFAASGKLTSTDSPVAVVALVRVIQGSDIPDFGVQAVESLARIRTMDAIKGLVSVALDLREHVGPVRNAATRRIKDIYDKSSDPSVRNLCRPVIDSYNR